MASRAGPPPRPRVLPDWQMVGRQRSYWATVYLRTWKGSVVTSFVMPLLYVLAMGVLLGGFVQAGADLDGAPTYLAFVAPGLVAAQAMQTATGETTWPVMCSIKWQRHLLRDGGHAARRSPTWSPPSWSS